MAAFIYEKPFQHGKDTTKYKLLTKDYVTRINVDGREIVRVAPVAL